ncbi:MAG: hypothetical protein HOV81_20255 [Kofleriaceae bacterium]|nr:hypothetical protein [Kofleriaceae bacterium]
MSKKGFGGTVVLVLAVAVMARVAVADDESDRKELVEDIDDKVEDELSDMVSRLDRVKGSDSRAQTIVRNYPGYISQFREAATYLRRQKELQRLADGIADRCASAESDLQSEIRRYVGDLDSKAADEGPTKLADLGKNLGRTWGDAMSKVRESEKEMRGAADKAQFRVSEDKWSYVQSNMSSASSGMLAYWNDKARAASDKCQRLEQGEKHPDIDKALATLASYSSNTKSTVTQLKRDYNAWLRDVRKLRSFSDQDRDAIRDAFCTAGEYEMEAKAKEVADRWASEINNVYGSVTGQGDRLRARSTATQMAKYQGPKDVIVGVEKNLANLAKLKGYELAGSNNPNIRTRIEWGNKRHDELEKACAYFEADVSSSYCRNAIRSGSNCRLDCIKDCQVIEFKPDNSKARAEGQQQVEAYRDGLDRWYKQDKTDLFKRYPDLARCESSDKTELKIKTDVVTYEMCSGTVKNQLGQQLDETTLEVSESPE